MFTLTVNNAIMNDIGVKHIETNSGRTFGCGKNMQSVLNLDFFIYSIDSHAWIEFLTIRLSWFEENGIICISIKYKYKYKCEWYNQHIYQKTSTYSNCKQKLTCRFVECYTGSIHHSMYLLSANSNSLLAKSNRSIQYFDRDSIEWFDTASMIFFTPIRFCKYINNITRRSFTRIMKHDGLVLKVNYFHNEIFKWLNCTNGWDGLVRILLDCLVFCRINMCRNRLSVFWIHHNLCLLCICIDWLLCILCLIHIVMIFIHSLNNSYSCMH